MPQDKIYPTYIEVQTAYLAHKQLNKCHERGVFKAQYAPITNQVKANRGLEHVIDYKNPFSLHQIKSQVLRKKMKIFVYQFPLVEQRKMHQTTVIHVQNLAKLK